MSLRLSKPKLFKGTSLTLSQVDEESGQEWFGSNKFNNNPYYPVLTKVNERYKFDEYLGLQKDESGKEKVRMLKIKKFEKAISDNLDRLTFNEAKYQKFLKKLESQVESTVDSNVVQDWPPNRKKTVRIANFPILLKKCFMILYIVFYKTFIQTFCCISSI